MKSRYEHFQNPGQRRRFALLGSSAVAVLVSMLFACAAFVPDRAMPGAQFGVDYNVMPARSVVALAAPRAGHVFEPARADDLYLLDYTG
jgi:hypothetical protein